MRCQSCGIDNAVDAVFCQSCGTALDNTGSRKENDDTIITSNDSLGTLIEGRFKIKKVIGKGGMGEIYLAVDERLKREVAVKSVSDESLQDNSVRARFLREAQTASQLTHPNICTIYEIYDDLEREYIVMEFVNGITLNQIIKMKTLGINKVMDIALQICCGMVEAHSKNIIHRDIKPTNIMVDGKGTVKILDFGLAKFHDTSFFKNNGAVDSNLTQKGVVMGTVAYMSPEQAKGHELDMRADIFSFGVVLYEMLEGRNPFQGGEQIETLYNVLNKEVEFQRRLPEPLKEIVRKLLAKSKKDRYATFKEVQSDLDTFRRAFDQIKDSNGNGDHTEILDISSQNVIMEDLNYSSDKEELGELVSRLKKMKAQADHAPAPPKRRWLKIGVPVVAVLVIVIVSLLLLFSPEQAPTLANKDNFYIYITPFKNETDDKSLTNKLNYLLTQSLNQYKEFKVIDTSVIASIVGNESGEDKVTELLKTNNIEFELDGIISHYKNIYNLEAELIPFNKANRSYSFTKTGEGKDSFLSHQVDSLARQIYKSILPDKYKKLTDFKKISTIAGSDWATYSNFYIGYSHYKKLDLDKASTYLEQANQLPASLYMLADIDFFNGKYNQALSRLVALSPVVNELPDELKLKTLALNARLKNNVPDAVEYLQLLQRRFQYSKGAYFELGELYFHQGDIEAAIPNYVRAVELDHTFSKAINHLGYCHSYLGDHIKAIQLFEEYRNLDQSANSFDSLGDGYFYSGELEDALALKNSALATNSRGVPWAYQTVADIHILRAEFRNAEKALDNYLKIRNDNTARAEVLSKRAFIQYMKEEYRKALKTINQSLKAFDSNDLNENSAEAHWLKGLIYFALKKYNDANREFEWLRQMKLDYKLSETHFRIPYKYFVHLKALIQEREGDFELAVETFKHLLSMKPRLSYWVTYYNYQFFHTELARLYFRRGKYQEALVELEECLKFSPQYLPALWLKGDTLDKLRDPAAGDLYSQISELIGASPEKNLFRNRLKKR
jgi:serine/threonine protein kinase/Flp pilus assembly protein TadD